MAETMTAPRTGTEAGEGFPAGGFRVMPRSELPYEREVPLRGLVISALALLAAGLVSVFWPEALEEYSGFVWILALVPLVLLSYYKGWKGAAVASVATMVIFTGVQLGVVHYMGRAVDWSYYGLVTIVLMAVSFGAGWVTEKLHRERIEALQMAYEDPLTGMASRRHLEEFLADQFAAAERGRPLAVVLFDLDAFKAYNDRYGHRAGDDILRQVGEVFRQNTREVNLSGRYGGEEFLTVLPDEDVDGARAFAERIRVEIERLTDETGETCTVSAGVAEYGEGIPDAQSLVERADEALYRAKAEGGNTVAVYPEGPTAA